MQLFIRDCSTVVVEADAACTVDELKVLFTLKAFGVRAPEPWMLLHNGRQLDDAITLAAAGVADGDALSASARVRGGGGDGGSTGAESRSCYLEMYAQKKPDKVNPVEEMLARWTRCNLSGERLAPPCVADELGTLFNREAVVHALLNKSMPPHLAHISGLKHVFALQLEPNPKAAKGAKAASSAAYQPDNECDFMCPITGLEVNGRFRFVAHRPSGRVLSERALKEVPAAVEELLGCRPAPEDLVPLNPSGEELARLKTQVAARLAVEREKKAKKDRKRAAADGGAGATANGGAANDGGGAAAAAGHGGPLADAGQLPPPAKKAKAAAAAAAASAAEKLPAGATPSVYASIFHKPGVEKTKETYCCRAVSGRPTLMNG